MIATTPKAPYYAVIFTTLRTEVDDDYMKTSLRMEELAKEQDGYLGIESARNKVGITVSYWSDLEAIKSWRNNTEHTLAREMGREKWYNTFKLRICKVERDYEF